MPTSPDAAVAYTERAVTVDPDGGHVRLAAAGADPVLIGPFANPALGREKAEAVRAIVAAVVREVVPPAGGATPDCNGG